MKGKNQNKKNNSNAPYFFLLLYNNIPSNNYLETFDIIHQNIPPMVLNEKMKKKISHEIIKIIENK